jgi:hypothetical protein
MRRRPAASFLALVLLPLGLATLATACEEEDPECLKNTECQEITCPNGSKMQTCKDGVCLQGDDCEVESSGGW